VSECPCGAPMKNGMGICPGCHHTLQVSLGDISSHWIDLDTVKGRQTRYGGTGGGRGGEKTLPVDARFLGWDADGSRLQETVKNTMATWARAVLEDRPVLAGATHDACLHVSCSVLRRSHPPRDDVPSVCRYLLGHADWIRTQHWAPEMLDEIVDLAGQLRRMVDRPAERWFIGPCDTCKRDLYAKAGALTAECKECQIPYNVQERRDWLLDQINDQLYTAAELARAVSWLGSEPLTAERIRKWASRKRITAHGTTLVKGRWVPTYRASDAAALLAQDSRPKAG
jgi:hypothetical protein